MCYRHRILHVRFILTLDTISRTWLICQRFTKLLAATWAERFDFLGHPRADALSMKRMSTILVGTKCHRIAHFVCTQANDAGSGDRSVGVWIVSGKLKGCKLGIRIDILRVAFWSIDLLGVAS